MNTELITEPKPTAAADPVAIASELAEVEARLETAIADEATAEVELRDLEAGADRAAAEQYLSGKPVKTDAKTDQLRTRLRAIRCAKISLVAKRDLLEADHQSANIDSLIASANRLNAERQNDYETAMALQAVSARLFARAFGDLGGSYPIHGRCGRNGILVHTDGVPAPYLRELSRISTELRSIGFTEAESICKTRPSEVAGGEQLRGTTTVSRVRELANHIECSLIAGELLPANYQKINPDVPTNLD